jgi:acetylornithine/N-succinyldiaminopimelate aminotransferase
VFFRKFGRRGQRGGIKLARKYSADRYGPGRSTIVTLWDSFHGRTVTTLSATGQDVFHQHFFPFTEGFVHIPANDTGALQKADDGTVCAVMLEAVQGEGGVKPIDAGFVRDIFRMAEEKDWLVIFDEVQSGLARTGKRFGFDHFGVRPDIITLAKALAGGLPLGPFLCNEKTENTLGPGSHASTFGGNPVSAAAALVVLDKIMNEAFYREVGEKGDYIRSKVISFRSPLIGAALGLGLMIGFQVRGVSHKALCGKLAEKGLLTLTAGSDVLRFLPPLTISYQEIDAGLEILKKVLDEEGKKR